MALSFELSVLLVRVALPSTRIFWRLKNVLLLLLLLLMVMMSG